MVENQFPPLVIAEQFSERRIILDQPIIGGGMSIGVAGAEYASAFAKLGLAGTLGGVGRVFLDGNRKLAHSLWKDDCLALQKEISCAREMSPDGIIGANILLAVRWHEQLIQAAVGPKEKKSKINYLVAGAGFHEDVPLWTKDHPEVALLLMASSDLAAVMMAKQWQEKHHRLPDAIIMEEPSTAGGHLGATRKSLDRDKYKLEFSIPALLNRLDDHGWNIPIIAAGGIWDRSDINRMLRLGARGVQMATRFVCTPECAVPPAFKQMYLNAGKEDIVLVDSPVGYPGRAIRNKFINQLEQGEIHDRCEGSCLTKCACRDLKTHFCVMDRLVRAFRGDVENGLFFCGGNAWRAKEQGIVPVSQIIEELTRNKFNGSV